MWKTLVSHYDEVSNTTRQAALEAYNDYHWKEDMTVDVIYFGTYAHRKQAQGLPQKFENFKQVWRICPTKDITVEQLQAKLLDVERDVGATPSGNHGVALSGQKDRDDKSKKKAVCKKDRKKLQCHNCKGFGHFARDCPSEKKDKSSGGSSSDNRALNPPEEVKVGDGRILKATAIGKINVKVHDGEKWVPRCLKDVRLVPDFGPLNLFSIVATTDMGYEAHFSKSTVVVKNSEGDVIVRGVKKGHSTYRMLIKVEKPAEACVVQKEVSASWDLASQTWTCRKGQSKRAAEI
ncbi:uncharacterized protein LOC112637402 [Camponotus floridanus]|uniref:uncharacterized protein LOC112637402 n=1 Tax=Camponotus floridanus TaxID=104421 RepID=UPI000DC6D14E|nr:uncharacterized protein LOC112637402 [Camponotus floridanus]